MAMASASRAVSGLARRGLRPPLPSCAPGPSAPAATAPWAAARRRQERGGVRPLSGPARRPHGHLQQHPIRLRPQPLPGQRRSLSDDLKRRAIDALKSGGVAGDDADAEADSAANADADAKADGEGNADRNAGADDDGVPFDDLGTFRNTGGVGKFGGAGVPKKGDGGGPEVPTDGVAAETAGIPADGLEDPAADALDAAAPGAPDPADGDAAESPGPLSAGVHLHEFAPKIVVAGVGGAGTNAVNNMVSAGLAGVEFVALNTDAQHLSASLSPTRLQIGTQLTSGLGCGANPDAGRLAAEESSEAIQSCIEDAHMVFITAGMGGGTGTGAAPVVAGLCYDLGILTVSVVTTPFRFEGTHRRRLALEGVDRLRQVSDTLICVPNQNLFNLAGEDTSFVDAFRLADDVLLAGVRSVTDLMTSPGLINLDFADVQSVMHGMGNALLGTGQACNDDAGDGEGDGGDPPECRAVRAARAALNNPLLGEGDADVGSAKGMLVNMSGGSDMTLREVDRAAAYVTERVRDPDANIIFGSAYDASLTGCVRVSVVATGIEEGSRKEKE